MDSLSPQPGPSVSDYDDFFARYAATFEKALDGAFDPLEIRDFFAEYFVSADNSGHILGGANDDSFSDWLKQGYDFYRAVGMRSMSVEGIAMLQIHDGHDRVRVSYVSRHVRKNSSLVDLRFDVAYLLQRRADGPKIFAFIAGDEMALYRAKGLVDANNKPVQ